MDDDFQLKEATWSDADERLLQAEWEFNECEEVLRTLEKEKSLTMQPITREDGDMIKIENPYIIECLKTFFTLRRGP